MLRVTAKGSLPEALHSLDEKKMTQATFSGKVEIISSESEHIKKNKFDITVNAAKQGKHIIGHSNYIEGRSIFTLTVEDAQSLINKFSGRGDWVGMNKKRVDFGEVIGKYIDRTSGKTYETTVGIIHYSKTGTHIVPGKPSNWEVQ